MNYLDINEVDNLGGHPFSLDDLKTLQDGQNDLSNGLSAMHYDNYGVALLSPPKIAISGGNFTSSQFWMVYFGIGGLVRVVANSGTALSGAPGAAFHIRVTTSYGPNDPVTYESGTPKNVHAVSLGELVHIDPLTAGGNDIPFTFFNLADWVDDPVNFVLSGVNTGVSGGFFKFRYRLLSNNCIMAYLAFKGEITTAVKVTLPLPYLVNNSFAHVVFCDNPTNSEFTARMTGPADGNEISISRIGGAGFTGGATVEMTGTHFLLEMKMRD